MFLQPTSPWGFAFVASWFEILTLIFKTLFVTDYIHSLDPQAASTDRGHGGLSYLAERGVLSCRVGFFPRPPRGAWSFRLTPALLGEAGERAHRLRGRSVP